MIAIGYFRFLLLYFRAVMVIISIICIIATGSVASENGRPFGIDDYFKLNRILELSLSSDGRMIVYVFQSQSLEKNEAVNNVVVRSTGERAKPVHLEAIRDGWHFTWIPGKNELAFLSDRAGSTQVYSFNICEGKLRRLTSSRANVSNFKFSHDGDILAYITSGNADDDSTSLYEEIFRSEQGVILNSDITSLYHFVNPGRSHRGESPETKLWLKSRRQEPKEMRITGEIRDFHWAPNGEKLSLLYVEEQNTTLSNSSYTSIGVLELPTMEFTPLAHAKASLLGGEGETFAGGEWLNDGSSIYIRRIARENAWNEKGYWTLLDLSKSHFSFADINWKLNEYYRDEKLIVGKAKLYIEKTINGERAVYPIEGEDLRRAEIVRGVEGTIQYFQFSEDFQTAAFINESLMTPPEIFVWRDGDGVRQLTHLNVVIAKRQLPRARRIAWNSRDGATVHGWLLEPIDSSSGEDKPWPLVAYVHGGPSGPIRNEFAYNFSRWPYPFQVYAVNGIAVFLPDYRGTKTYGNDFATPKEIDGEPVYDILSGIDYLIKTGIADPDGIGIAGHSHGAWLGPLVMTRSNRFQAGSFAEGIGNTIVAYELMPGALNRITHDVQWGEGASLYENPQRYIELSPSMQFRQLRTAVLFEAGAKSVAVMMLGYQKAARFAGMPSELVVYPKTGHNMVLPRLKYESATRNLDWFRFWLQGYEDPAPEKQDQYARWRKMRDERCAWDEPKDEMPSYCEYSSAVH